MYFGGNFCPRGFAYADGQLLSIAQNQALFSILGTTYGGDGRTTFALPDFRGRAALNRGTGPGLQTKQLGQLGGAQTKTLTIDEMPSHNHLVNGGNNQVGFGNRTAPGTDFLGVPSYNAPDNPAEDLAIYVDEANVKFDPRMVDPAGGNQPFSIENPYLAVSVCIALNGIFPSRI